MLLLFVELRDEELKRVCMRLTEEEVDDEEAEELTALLRRLGVKQEARAVLYKSMSATTEEPRAGGLVARRGVVK